MHLVGLKGWEEALPWPPLTTEMMQDKQMKLTVLCFILVDFLLAFLAEILTN